MMYAEWLGTRVRVYKESKQLVRQFSMPYDVASVQVTGDSTTDAVVAISMVNGKTHLYKTSGQLIRK